PTPWDFFRTMERFAGRELDWFFRPWYFETEVLDHGIVSVASAADGTTMVTVERLGEALAPVLVVGETASGESATTTLDATVWMGGARTATATLTSAAPLVRVQLDP